jgi:hypothetical protein
MLLLMPIVIQLTKVMARANKKAGISALSSSLHG